MTKLISAALMYGLILFTEWLITICFEIPFDFKIATGIYLVGILLRFIFGTTNGSKKE